MSFDKHRLRIKHKFPMFYQQKPAEFELERLTSKYFWECEKV